MISCIISDCEEEEEEETFICQWHTIILNIVAAALCLRIHPPSRFIFVISDSRSLKI